MAGAELRYETRQALEEFLSSLDADYGQYAQVLFQKGVRKRSQIASASDTILTDCGVLPFHVGDLKVKCNSGLLLTFSSLSPPQTSTNFAVKTNIARLSELQ